MMDDDDDGQSDADCKVCSKRAQPERIAAVYEPVGSFHRVQVFYVEGPGGKHARTNHSARSRANLPGRPIVLSEQWPSGKEGRAPTSRRQRLTTRCLKQRCFSVCKNQTSMRKCACACLRRYIAACRTSVQQANHRLGTTRLSTTNQ